MSTATDLPAEMPVAVYRAVGEVVVEARPVPAPGPGQVLVEVSHCGICGSDLHMMVEGWGRPGYVGGHEWTGTSPRSATTSTGGRSATQVVGGPSPKCGRCRRCLRAGRRSARTAAAHRRRRARGRVRRLHPRSTPGRCCRCPTACRCATRRWPSRWPSRCTASPAPASPRATGPGVRRRARSARSSIAALVARGIGPVTVVEPAPAPGRAGPAARRRAGAAPRRARGLPACGSPSASPTSPSTSCSSARARRSAMEAGFNQLRRGGRLVMVGAGIEPPDASTPTACSSTS